MQQTPKPLRRRVPLAPFAVVTTVLYVAVVVALREVADHAADAFVLATSSIAAAGLLGTALARRAGVQVRSQRLLSFFFLATLSAFSGVVVGFVDDGASFVYLAYGAAVVVAVLGQDESVSRFALARAAAPAVALGGVAFAQRTASGIAQLTTALVIVLCAVATAPATASLGSSSAAMALLRRRSASVFGAVAFAATFTSALSAVFGSLTWRLLVLAAAIVTAAIATLVVLGRSSVLLTALSSITAVCMLFGVNSIPTPAPVAGSDAALQAAIETLPLPAAPKTSTATGRDDNVQLPGSSGYSSEYSGWSFAQCDQLRIIARDCFITYFTEQADTTGVKKAVDELVSSLTTGRGKQFFPNCHETSHALGRMAALAHPNDVSKALALDPLVCGGGFTHGVWEETMARTAPGELEANAGTFCSARGQASKYQEWTCIHILGHFLALRHFSDPAQGIIHCLALPERNHPDCLAGGWMEYWVADTVTRYYNAIGSVPRLFEVCAAADERIAGGCYLEMFPTLENLVGYDFKKVFAACEMYSPKQFVVWCADGVGRGVAVSQMYNQDAVTGLCRTVTSQAMRDHCFTASAAAIAMYRSDTVKPLEMCELVADVKTRTFCRSWITGTKALFSSGTTTAPNLNAPATTPVIVPQPTNG